MRSILPIILVVLCPVAEAAAQQPAPVPAPLVTITLGPRQGRVTPHRQGFCHTGGGNIDVAQPAPDTVVITMTGVAVAGGHPCRDSLASLAFDVVQQFEVAFDKPELKTAKLTLEARVIGLLRSQRGGGAQQGPAQATMTAGPAVLATVDMPPHAVAECENLSVNDREGPMTVAIGPGKYCLHQTFQVTASHPHTLTCAKASSAEFAPDPALDPLWISYWEPFHGAIKKDFGFQVVLKVAP